MKTKKTKGRKCCLTHLKQSPGGKHLVWSEQGVFQHREGVTGQSEEWPEVTEGPPDAESGQCDADLCRGVYIYRKG